MQGGRKQTDSISLLPQGLWGRPCCQEQEGEPTEKVHRAFAKAQQWAEKPATSGSALPGLLPSARTLGLSVALCVPRVPSHRSPDAYAWRSRARSGRPCRDRGSGGIKTSPAGLGEGLTTLLTGLRSHHPSRSEKLTHCRPAFPGVRGG